MSSEIEILFSEIKKFGFYPAGIKRITGNISGNIFFPGGPGIFNPGNGKISDKEIMIVGDQFDPNLNFNKLHGLRMQRIRISPGWSNLLLLLVNGGIDPVKAFFTNVLLGARIPGNKKRPSLIMKRRFKAHCRCVFRMELEMQKPKVILVLGLKAARFLSSLHPELEGWGRLKSFSDIDGEGIAVIDNLYLTGSSASTLVLLLNPKERLTHIRTRKFRKYAGDNAEIRMLLSVHI